jgi:hypothetical protein
MMDYISTPRIIDILAWTLCKVEEDAKLKQDDPAVLELKKQVLLTIAELEVTSSSLDDLRAA